ncbi:ABC transporter permease [Penaeicola halotolerans]|uniref:ABC transporter permease n=1 Tax=Penaeicola halotolerans TaxID=2793196 RepID=UPI001CF82A4B|nr:ABC transporter permease [Penaeicola halotolerans]
MNLVENIKEGLRSIKANLLRTVLTGLIIAIGITSLVGMLTAIDGIKYQIENSLSSLGANNFDIRSKGFSGRRSNVGGVEEKVYPPIDYKEATRFKEIYDEPANVTIFASVSFATEVKRGSKKTNPNIRVTGGDENYFRIKGSIIEKGRNFSNVETQYGANVAIVGTELVKALFNENEDPLGQQIAFFGRKYTIVGVLEAQGGLGGDNAPDRAIIIPLINANTLARSGGLRYIITVAGENPAVMEREMGEATGLMRKVRGDEVIQENSFEVSKSQSLSDSLEEVTGYLRIGGFGIGFITLLGAAVGLMNIMMVSVTERTREIGVRKALGATPLRIRQQFLIEAIVICQLGGILGAFLGILIGNVVASFIGSGGFIIPWFWIMVAFIICAVVGLSSGFYPAYKASKLDPIDALRFE